MPFNISKPNKMLPFHLFLASLFMISFFLSFRLFFPFAKISHYFFVFFSIIVFQTAFECCYLVGHVNVSAGLQLHAQCTWNMLTLSKYLRFCCLRLEWWTVLGLLSMLLYREFFFSSDVNWKTIELGSFIWFFFSMDIIHESWKWSRPTKYHLQYE